MPHNIFRKPRASFFVRSFTPATHPTATAGASAVTGKLTAKHVFRRGVINGEVVASLYAPCRPCLHRGRVNNHIGLATVQEQSAKPPVVHNEDRSLPNPLGHNRRVRFDSKPGLQRPGLRLREVYRHPTWASGRNRSLHSTSPSLPFYYPKPNRVCISTASLFPPPL